MDQIFLDWSNIFGAQNILAIMAIITIIMFYLIFIDNWLNLN